MGRSLRREFSASGLHAEKGEVERIDVIARAVAKDISWTADLVLLVNGKRRLLPLSKKGEHWRTIGTQNIPVTQLGTG
jgi:hypothetical protein